MSLFRQCELRRWAINVDCRFANLAHGSRSSSNNRLPFWVSRRHLALHFRNNLTALHTLGFPEVSSLICVAVLVASMLLHTVLRLDTRSLEQQGSDVKPYISFTSCDVAPDCISTIKSSVRPFRTFPQPTFDRLMIHVRLMERWSCSTARHHHDRGMCMTDLASAVPAFQRHLRRKHGA